MGLRGHGAAIAITAAVTVGLASAGTAVAVTSSVVTIADPTNLAQQARVDTSGRLSVTAPTATINSTGLASVTAGDNFVTSPTAATLALTKISFSNPSVNAAASSAELRFYVYQVAVTGGSCSNSYQTLLGIYNVAPGDDFEDAFATPLIVKPVGSTKFCLDLYAVSLNGAYNANYYPSDNIAAYVVSGKYTPAPAAATAEQPADIAKREHDATQR